MISIRKAGERGHADHGWLNTYHTFSFSSYRDPKHVDNMEIVTYVLEGALEHRDSMGNGEVLRPGEFQRMSAGTGITHGEFNPSSAEPVHLYQIWLFPEERNIEPSYEQKSFDATERHNRLRLVASRDATDGSLRINQDARIFLATLDEDTEVRHELAPSRHAWLQVLRGSINVGNLELSAGDGVAISDESSLTARSATDGSEVMLFDLA
jgi:quercetin 2,3-dioxygenase